MVKVKNVAVTSFASDSAMYLEIEGVGRFSVSQYTSGAGINEIPKASCLVAVGRDARQIHKLSALTQYADKLLRLRRAKVVATIQGEWSPTGGSWEGTQTIFDGYFVGLGWRQASGDMQPVISLVHWLITLSFSSTLSATQNTANPASLVAPAVTPTIGFGLGGNASVFASQEAGDLTIAELVPQDLWAALKTLYCALTTRDQFRLTCATDDFFVSPTQQNTRAQEALSRIEGPGLNCQKEYEFARPLKMDVGSLTMIAERIARGIVGETTRAYAQTDFWSNLVANHCAAFSMCVIPMIDRALVVADTPTFRTPWKKITPDDFEYLESSGMLTRPLRGVGIYGDYGSMFGLAIQANPEDPVCIGGQYFSDAEEDQDGTLLVQPAPLWLQGLTHTGDSGKFSGSGRTRLPNAASPGGGEKPEPGQLSETLQGINTLYNRYAESVFQRTSLRSRIATISGKLRFDIAPGTILQIDPKPEPYAGERDSLATPLIGQVFRVTTSINAESKAAVTTLQLSHVRTEKENEASQTSSEYHPLYGEDVYSGAPMIPEWGFDS